jgi:hypothetical protein
MTLIRNRRLFGRASARNQPVAGSKVNARLMPADVPTVNFGFI